MKKRVRIYGSRYFLSVILTCMLFLSCAVAAPIFAAYAKSIDFHGIDITDYDSIDVYRMKIPLGNISKAYCLSGSGTGIGTKAFKGVDLDVLITFWFPNITVKDEVSGKDYNIFVTGRTRMHFPSNFAMIFGGKVKFLESEITLSLSNNYYKYLEKINADFSKVQISVGNEGNSVLLSADSSGANTFEMEGIEIYSVGVPPSVFDPDDPDFDIDEGNTGTNLAPEIKPTIVTDKATFWDRLVEFWKAMPKWAKALVIVPLVLLVIGLIFKVIKWVVK